MKRYFPTSLLSAVGIICALLMMVLMISSCGVGGGSSNTNFHDKLTLGTGMSGFTLLGEASSFSVAATGGVIYFRLESLTDISDRFVRLYITNLAGVPAGQKDIIPPQPYGHIMVSAFNVTTPGNWIVKGYLVDTTNGVEESFIADTPMTLTP